MPVAAGLLTAFAINLGVGWAWSAVAAGTRTQEVASAVGGAIELRDAPPSRGREFRPSPSSRRCLEVVVHGYFKLGQEGAMPL